MNKGKEVVKEWIEYWSNQTINESDTKNYRRRALGVDANMKYDLALRIDVENAALKEKLEKAREGLRVYANAGICAEYGNVCEDQGVAVETLAELGE